MAKNTNTSGQTRQHKQMAEGKKIDGEGDNFGVKPLPTAKRSGGDKLSGSGGESGGEGGSSY